MKLNEPDLTTTRHPHLDSNGGRAPDQVDAVFHVTTARTDDGGYATFLEPAASTQPSPAYLSGFAAALLAAAAAVLQENADGYGWQWPGRRELAERIRGLKAEDKP